MTRHQRRSQVARLPPQSPDSHGVIAIVGPTAVGKSAVAHLVAQRLGGEIVVADPFQRYRGLEIAADSPRPPELDQVRYHLVGDLDLHQASNVAQYAAAAHAAIDDILVRGRVPIVSGGTGLYVRAALADLEFPPEARPESREEAARLVATDLAAAGGRLRHLLGTEAASRVDLANPRRVERALALALSGHGPAPADDLWTATTRHPTLIVGLVRERAEIDRLIEARVHREIADGLVEELEAALDHPRGISREAAQIIGAREVAAMRAGTLTRDELPARLAARTRKLARSQLTWLRKTPGVMPIATDDVATGEICELIVERVVRPTG